MTTKLHVAVDEKGRPLKMVLTGGQRHDICSAPELLEGYELEACYILADKGYDSSDFVKQIEEAGGIAVIPSRSTNRKRREYDREMYKNRNQVERFFNRMKQYRRFATRYEKTAKSFLALVYFVAVFVYLAISRL
jgi:transposase